MLELGRRRSAPLNLERVLAALVGGLVGWGMNSALTLHRIRLVVPRVAPPDLATAAKAA